MKIIYLLIAALAVASGCVSSSVKTSNDAIVINSFSADPQLAEPDDAVNFFLDVENVGGTTARCITAELYGIESWCNSQQIPCQPFSYARSWRSNGFGFDYTNGQLGFSWWDPSKGYVDVAYSRQLGLSLSSYVANSWTQVTDNFCGAASSWTQYPEVKFWNSMSPAVPAQNKPGQSFTTQWVFRPPTLPEGVHTSYPVTARVSYLYTSNAQLNLQAFNKNEYERRQALGQQTTFPIVVENTYASPMQVVVVRGQNPIVVNQRAPLTGGSNYELANYLIEFQNVGNGWPLPFGSDVNVPNGFIFATIELNGPGASFYDCLGATSGSEIMVTGDVIQNLVKLRADRNAPFGCTIAIDRTAWADTPMGTISLTFNLWYRYYTDSTINVDVLGKQENI